jgi:hypothetical protein
MGGDEASAQYREQLEREIEESFGHYKLHNDSKNIFKAANTPITLAAVAMLVYVLSQIMSLIGLYALANLLNLIMTITFGMLAVWGYTRYSGNASELGTTIDSIATAVWDSALMPAVNKLAEEGTQLAARQAVQRLNSTTSPQSTAMSAKKKRN